MSFSFTSESQSVFCYISTIGVNMEMLGHKALWEIGLNYGHGTGHGVGNYFGVHECKTQTYLSIMYY